MSIKTISSREIINSCYCTIKFSQDRIRLGNQLSNAFYIVYTSSAVSPNPQYTGKINMSSNTNQNVFLSYVTIYYMYNQSIPISSSASASILNGTVTISRSSPEPQVQDTFLCLFTLAKFSETALVRF